MVKISSNIFEDNVNIGIFYRPWLTAFYRSKAGNLEFICGGSLIATKYVLTVS
jgi:hypothetical protein